MKNNYATSIILLAITCLLLSCRATTLQNIERSEFSTSFNVSLSQIKQAIIRACKKSGWKVKSTSQNAIIAAYSYKRNKFGAVVRINYNRNSYDISYLSSHNLKYTEYQDTANDSSGFMDDSKAVFKEYNPFSKSEQQANTQKPATIHKRYNQWVTALDQKISSELKALGRYSVTSRSNNTRSSIKSRPVSQVTNCDDQPSSSASGPARITKNSVNIRNGANTKCQLIGSVSRNETFTLLGRKNNWYYIALNQNQNAWIYAPFVQKVDDIKQEINRPSAPTPPVTPEAPVTPTKTISIAVIHFKTLNKEAQEISLGDLVSETFTSALVNSQSFRIIEREQLDKVVKEMEMNQTGFIETTDAVEIGKMLHADAIITGSVALLNNQIQLNARIIEIESAYVISADSKTTSYTLQNITRITNEIVAKLSRKLIKKIR